MQVAVNAAIALERELEHEPGLAEALVARGEVLLVRGERAAAARTFAEVLDLPGPSQAVLRSAAVGLAEATEPADPAAVDRLVAALTSNDHCLPEALRRRLDRLARRADPPATGSGPLHRAIEVVERQFAVVG